MSTLSELKEEVARLKKLKEDIKSRKENEANQIKAKTKGLEIFFDEFKETHHMFYQMAFSNSIVACGITPKIENIYALTFNIAFKLSLFIAFRLDDKNILKDNDYLFAMLFKKHFNSDYWTENNEYLLEAKRDFEEYIKKYPALFINKNNENVEDLKICINKIFELFYDFCDKILGKNDIDFNNFISSSEIDGNKSINIDEYFREANDFNYKISKKLNLINNDSEWNNILKSVKLFIEPIATRATIITYFDYVAELWPLLEKQIFCYLKIISIDRNNANILVLNVKLNCYLIFCIKLYEIDKEIFENSSQILNLKKFILGSAASASYPKINEENIIYFLDSYKKGTSSFMFLDKFMNAFSKIFKNEIGALPEASNTFNKAIDNIFLNYFFIFDLLTAHIDKNIDTIKKEFRELISFNAFDGFTDDEYASLLKDDFYYKALSEKTAELYKRFNID